MNWNFDMSAAPRDPKVKIMVADPGSKPGAESVFESHWIPVRLTSTGKVLEGDRWSGFTRGREPIAWMPLPEYPHSQSDVGEVAAVMGHARLANAAGVEPPTSGLFLLDDVGSGA